MKRNYSQYIIVPIKNHAQNVFRVQEAHGGCLSESRHAAPAGVLNCLPDIGFRDIPVEAFEELEFFYRMLRVGNGHRESIA